MIVFDNKLFLCPLLICLFIFIISSTKGKQQDVFAFVPNTSYYKTFGDGYIVL